jgi:transmembrane sensor
VSAGWPTLAQLAAIGPARAAAFWLERLDHDERDAADDLFQAWLAAHEDNRDAWDHALDAWDSFDEADDSPALAEMRQDALSLRRRPAPALWLGFALAASAAAATIAVFVRPPAPPAQHLAQAAPPEQRDDYRTAIGERRTVTLRDGSTVTLDTGSAIQVAYRADRRLVRLTEGQALFDVVHDPARPFRVAAGERIVTVLGTRFDVRVSNGETRVLLMRGSIGVSKGTDPASVSADFARLVPGQQLVARTGAPDRIGHADAATVTAWQRGFVQFDAVTLEAAVAELNRYTTQRIVIHDPRVRRLRISGAFPTGDTDRFLQTLIALYPVHVLAAPDGTIDIAWDR